MKPRHVTSLALLCAGPASAQYGFNDGGFDAQGASVASYCYLDNGTCPTGPWSGWKTGFIHSGNIDWGGLTAPSPSTYAFIQIAGTLSQSFNATQTKRVRFTWLEADRPLAGWQTYHVTVNGLQIGTYTSSGTVFIRRYSSPFDIIQGTWYTLTFTGESPTVDRSALIDGVRLVADDSSAKYSYDALGRLVSSIHSGGAGDGSISTYSLDAVGNRTSVAISGVQP